MKRKSLPFQGHKTKKTYQNKDFTPDEIVYTKKQIRTQIDNMRKVHAQPLKDKEGNNLKQHAGLWKYVKTNGKVAKIYISKQCRIYTDKEASTQYNLDTHYQPATNNDTITSLVHWRIPIGLIEAISAETKVTTLYNWQVCEFLGGMS
jgi:hypothetical protein